MTLPDPDTGPFDPAEALRRIAWQMGEEWFGTGPLAALRRLDPAGALAEPALQRLLATLPEPWVRGEGERAWSMLIHLLALAAPQLHRGGAPLGAALQAAGYSEGRLTRLLQARPAEFTVLLPRMVRFLVAKGQKLDIETLRRLVLAEARGNAEAAEAIRTAIARAYYRAEATADRKAATEEASA
jgi:CRISPR system Cascade subunit CasB